MSDDAPIITECPYCNTEMDISAVAPFSRVACPSCNGEMRVKVRFGPYQLEKRLAIGGMSVVFLARDTLLDREVAVKILNEDYSADERRISAFEEEARITASLSHPNIVRVLTTGRAFGRFFIAMELVPGGHFEHHIREAGKVPEKKMLKLAIQIANGLKAAKAANLIHRDIKPGNILLDANGNARIVDFGLALVTQGGKAQAKEFWATPYYVPPETIDGEPEDFRADIYAFGATLYHALAGKPPCNEESMSTDVLRAAKKHIKPLHEANPQLSMPVCRIVDKAMAYEPAKRHGSYDELLRELQTASKNLELGIDTDAAANQPADRHARRKRNQRVARAAAVLVGGVVLISGLAWLAGGGGNDAGAPDPGIANGGNATAPPDGVDLAKLHEQARAAVSARSFGAAADAFARLHKDDRLLEPTRTWAGVQAVVAALLDEDHEQAMELARAARVHLSKVDSGDPSASLILRPMLARLESGDALSVNDARPEVAGPASLITCLILGIHEWQTNGHLAAQPYFQTVVEIKLDESDGWASIYQDVAYDHLADLAMLRDPAYLDDPPDILAANNALERVGEMRNEVRTRGPVGNLMDQRISELKSIIRRFERAAEAANRIREEPEDERGVDPGDRFVTPPPPPLDPPGVPLRADRPTVLRLLADYEFGGALETMRKLDEDQIDARQRTVWMATTRQADAFFTGLCEELAANAFEVNQVKLKNGEILDKLATGSAQGLRDTDNRMIPWADLHADTFIEWHRARSRRVTDESERKKMHEEAIAFDLVAGDPQRARIAIARLSESDFNIERYWAFILDNLPK